jgi:hypothetical protein
VGFPLCPGRLTLFATFSLQMVALEGFVAVGRLLARFRGGSVLFAVAVVGLALACSPTAFRKLHHLYTRDVPQNVRPLLHHIEARPNLPVLVAACSETQVSTLPEWIEREDILYYNNGSGKWYRRYPKKREFFVLSAGSEFYCEWFFDQLSERVESSERYHEEGNTASLQRVVLQECWHPLKKCRKSQSPAQLHSPDR